MTDRYQPLREAIAAGTVQLPEWFDCKVAVERGDATALQRFIHDYDDADPDRSKAFFAMLRAVLDEARPDPDTISALLKERDALRDALSEAQARIAAIGYPASPDGEYSKDGEWTFSDAVPRAVDAGEVKAAFLVIRAALADGEKA